MKTPKRLFITALVAVGAAFAISSCHKSSSSSVTITEADAAGVATDAIDPSTGGMVSQIDASAVFATNGSTTVNAINPNHLKTDATGTGCGIIKDTTASYASLSDIIPSFTYSLTWQNSLSCSTPATFTCNFAGKGSYSGLTFSSQFNSAGSFVISGLSSTDASYTFNSNFQRQGVAVSKIGAQNTFDHSLTITSSNIVYNKTSEEITSGTATVAITVTSSSGQSWNYSGTLTFLGSKTAKLVMASGTVYNIIWS